MVRSLRGSCAGGSHGMRRVAARACRFIASLYCPSFTSIVPCLRVCVCDDRHHTIPA